MLNRFEQGPRSSNEPIITATGSEVFPFIGVDLPKLSHQELTQAYMQSLPRTVAHSDVMIQTGYTRPINLGLDLVLANRAILDRTLELSRANNLGRDIHFDNDKITETTINTSVIEAPLNGLYPADFSSTKSVDYGIVITQLPLLLRLKLESPRTAIERSIQSEMDIDIHFGGTKYTMDKKRRVADETVQDAGARMMSDLWLNSNIDPKSKKIIMLPYNNATLQFIGIKPVLDTTLHQNP